MVFVDGSNLLIELGSTLSVKVRSDQPGTDALSMATQCVTQSLADVFSSPIGPHKVTRKYWFGAIQGSQEHLQRMERELRDFGYEAVLFSKRKNGREKGVDLAVAREMLIHGFNRNYRTAILVAGDEDYLGLVQDLKRLGLVVVGLFFDGPALSPRLRVALDLFIRMRHPYDVNRVLAQQLQSASGE